MPVVVLEAEKVVLSVALAVPVGEPMALGEPVRVGVVVLMPAAITALMVLTGLSAFMYLHAIAFHCCPFIPKVLLIPLL